MIRQLLALTAGVLCALMGLRRSREAQQRRLRLERWPVLLRHLALLIREEAGSLTEVLRLCARENAAPDRLILLLARHMQEHPLLPPDALLDTSALPRDEGDLLQRMAIRLAQGSRDSRAQAAESCAAAMEALLAGTRERSDADAKMWRQLGMLGGACLTLWLL